MIKIQEASRISGVSVRTLHYYDQIGLLSPEKQMNGYRYYSESDLDRLQRILYYRYLGFPLKKIREMMTPGFEQKTAPLEEQLTLLRREQERIRILIQTLEETIAAKQGGREMETENKFQGFSYDSQKQYRAEAVEKYGEEVILESERRQKGNEEQMVQDMNRVFFALADNQKAGLPAQNAANVALVKDLHQTIRTFSFDCNLEVFGKIGKGYVADERFRKNIDQFGEGTAQYACDAIQVYVEQEE